jgi:hypothetical protein
MVFHNNSHVSANSSVVTQPHPATLIRSTAKEGDAT